MVVAIPIWSPDDWEIFALSLLQHRHGPLNVMKVPAAHKGDWGIDYYGVRDHVVYQCFSVNEPVDITIRADRQKIKITTDLNKLILNNVDISKIFLNAKIRYWVLLVPLHDSREVNLHCAKKTLELRAQCHSHLDENFEVRIDDIAMFPGNALSNTFNLMTIPSHIIQTTAEDLNAWSETYPDLLQNTSRKLNKRAANAKLDEAISDSVRAFLEANALLHAFRSNSPELHEKITTAISMRSRRLSIGGPAGGSDASGILNAEIDQLVNVIKDAAPNLSKDNAERIALGTASDWIMRCPLDFPPYDR